MSDSFELRSDTYTHDPASYDAWAENYDVDLSPQSVARAASRGVYRNVAQKDMSQLPFAQATDSYGARTCIGVLTYIPKPQPVIQEFCRLTKPGGFVIITQRADIYSQLGFGQQLREIEASGSCRVRLTSDPQPYLPDHADYSDNIKVIYIALEVMG